VTLFHGKELFYIGLPYMPYRMPYRMPYLFARIALIFNGLPYMSHTYARAHVQVYARAHVQVYARARVCMRPIYLIGHIGHIGQIYDFNIKKSAL